MRADIEGINRGEAIRHGDTYLINGRLYGIEPTGRAYPISGSGVHELDRLAFRAVGVYNTFGLTERAEGILDKMRSPEQARVAARRACDAERGR